MLKAGRALSFAEVLEQSRAEEIVGVGASQSKRLWAEDASQQAKESRRRDGPLAPRRSKSAVDRETGVIKLIRVVSAHDVGKAINPLAVTGQIQGGIMMGLGYALSESLLFDEGKITNASFADYKIPTARDIPGGDADYCRKTL